MTMLVFTFYEDLFTIHLVSLSCACSLSVRYPVMSMYARDCVFSPIRRGDVYHCTKKKKGY